MTQRPGVAEFKLDNKDEGKKSSMIEGPKPVPGIAFIQPPSQDRPYVLPKYDAIVFNLLYLDNTSLVTNELLRNRYHIKTKSTRTLYIYSNECAFDGSCASWL